MVCLKKGWHFPCPSSMVRKLHLHNGFTLRNCTYEQTTTKPQRKRKGQKGKDSALPPQNRTLMPAWLTDEENEEKFTLIFTHKNKQCIGAMKNRSKAGIVHWKHLRLHKYRRKSSGIWPLKTKQVHASPSSKKDSRYSTASCNKFYDSLTNANTKARQDNNVVVAGHSKPKSSCQSI